MLQDYGLAIGIALAFAVLGWEALVLFVGQAVFAVYCFEVITYVHHYGLVRREGGGARAAARVGAPLLDHELPDFQQHLPQRPSSSPARAVL